jgi:hypothetical protein
LFRLAAPLALALGVCAALAQPARGRADPLDATASVPPARHESALKSYRRFDEVQTAPWRQSNETVERIGGWRSYAREGQAPAAPQAAQPASAPNARPPAAAPAPRSEPPKPAPGDGGHKH